MTFSPAGADHFEKSTPLATKYEDGSHKKRCSPLVIGNTCLGIGAFLVIFGIVYGAALPSVITNQIESGVAVCSESDIAKEQFTDNYGDCDECVPYYYSLIMFNVTNANDYLKNGAKLKVQEVGPYAYRRFQRKVDVKLEGDLVSYKMYTYHKFDAEKSCETCKDTDVVTSWDLSYLNVISQAGGEKGFVTRLAKGTTWGAELSDDEIADVVEKNGEQMMRWVNGLNSNQPKAWKAIGETVLPFLAGGVAPIEDLDLSGFEYNGLFAQRQVKDYALGFPSLLAGLGLGTNYVKVCSSTSTTKLEEKCASCKGDACDKIWSECKKCVTGKKVLAINAVTCASIEARYAAVYGEKEAKAFSGSTCGLCESVGLCAAPLPGAAEASGLDYSEKAPSSDSLNTYIQRTGCDDKTHINDYIQYDGFKTQPYWVKLDKRRNPTLTELNAFAVYGNCEKRTSNMTCSDVMGTDATSIEPAGASITGFPSKVDLQEAMMYLNQAKQNISLVNTGEVVEYEGIKLTRFIPPNDLLQHADWKDAKGTGYPVDGVQPLAFNVGFLAYLSYPMFIYGDKSLMEGVEITMADGVKASQDTLFEDGVLKEAYYNRYQTTVDIEPGTGKTMVARKRLMASYALGKSSFSDGVMSDLVWPKLKAEVISPAYFGEESATITPSRISTYKGVKAILTSLLPVMIIGIVLGVALVAGGFLYRRKAQMTRRDTMGDAILGSSTA
ncbi:hypothetical protein Poli38472_014441 [Pythium oligandrum]|uniref:Uncharacterized protein n=1 Tax=Pythium oligandrum TaxID=41045 RepID=A0A8K1FGJ3_PYTOL|nr:hypothetical protein Poli38472_014441 [Pythium oligandrum]|eukprot:TMW57838.1 hypothetical protein Poli38472_014441 [Pythium oligandrum]